MRNRNPFEMGSDTKDVSTNDVGSSFSLEGLHVGWPIGLLIIWVVVFLVELSFGGLSQSAIDKWPVAMGNVSHINFVIKPLTHWVTELSHSHEVASFLLGIFSKLVTWLVIVICSATTGFFHLSWAHLVGNAFFYVIFVIGLLFIGVSGITIVRVWFGISCAAIGTVWSLFELGSSISQIIQAPDNMISLISQSNVPIAGASAGLFGLLGFLIFQILRQFKFSVGRGLLFIAAIATAIIFLYSKWDGLGTYNLLTQNGSAALMGACMHFLGFFYGCLRGLRYSGVRSRSDY